MNAIAIAFTAALVAGGAAYAHGGRPTPPHHPAGTLTCTTRATAGLVFGLTPVADCTFVSSRGGFRQAYVALFSPSHRVHDTAVTETIRWDVMTKDGFSRPGMLGGTFNTLIDRPEISTAAGTAARGGPVTLKLVSHSGQRIANFVLGTPRVAFAAGTDVLVR